MTSRILLYSHPDLSHIRKCIWDLDGVLFTIESRYPNVDFKPVIAALYAETVHALLPEVSHEDAAALAASSYLMHGNSITGVVEFAETTFGKNKKEFGLALHEEAHAKILPYFEQHYPDLIKYCVLTDQGFEKLEGRVRHGTATHSSLKCYGKPILERNRLFRYFNLEALLDQTHSDFIPKGISPKLVGMALEALNAKPGEAAFADDDHRHLNVAKKQYGDLTAVHITPALSLQQPQNIDVAATDAPAFLARMDKDVPGMQFSNIPGLALTFPPPV